MALLARRVERIGRPPGEPWGDRAPEWVASGSPEPLRSELEAVLADGRLLTRASDLVRYASDASPYRYIPRAVVVAHDPRDVAAVLAYGRRAGVPVTLRAGGTSLNGQAQSDGILVDVRRHFAGIEVEAGGERCRVKPGTVLSHANRVLAPHGRKLGPDPASTDAATVGGVIANNSGGMRCGVVRDSYSTVRAMKLVLASGTEIDTEAPGAEEELARRDPELAVGLAQIRDEIRGDAELRERIRRKFEIKNTMGYRLCAFLDAETPLEILRRLVIGSEGTLAFVAEAVFETVPLPAATTVSWLHFPNIDAAVAPVTDLVAAGASAVELMVAPALIVASHNIPGTPEHWRELPPESAALLVEFGGTGDELDAAEARAAEVLSGHDLLRPSAFTRNDEEIAVAWRVREGMFGLIGRLRAPGTALITEDVCVAPERIAEASADVQALLGEHGFLTGVTGHASAGNLHFTLTPDLAAAADRERYEAFMGALVDLIVGKYDGSLKAEHGTGLNMAPYLEREWGPKATAMMWRIKQLADPDGVLAPGVMLNRDPGVHLRNLKSTPPIEEVATACVECGMCEPVCPSRNTTTTPRQRILLRREMARQPEDAAVLAALVDEFEHDGIQTCAADGSCGPACPLAIDTGAMIKGFRSVEATDRSERLAELAARNWAAVELAGRLGLAKGGAIAGVVGHRAVDGVARAARLLAGADLVPRWPPSMPPPASPSLPATRRDGAAAVYMPACINRIFGNARGTPPEPTLPEALVEVSRRAGLPLWIPDDVAGRCCATPWSSKGYREGHRLMASTVAESVLRWTEEGALPLVVDASSCAQGLTEEVGPALDEGTRDRFERVQVLDSIEWAHDRLLPILEVNGRVATVAVHPTCSVEQLGLRRELESLAAALSEQVVVPAAAGCCGMAGDRGLLHPELPASALRDEAAELEDRHFDACLCSNRTCEIGLQQETGRPFESFVFLLQRLTR